MPEAGDGLFLYDLSGCRYAAWAVDYVMAAVLRSRRALYRLGLFPPNATIACATVYGIFLDVANVAIVTQTTAYRKRTHKHQTVRAPFVHL